MVTEQRFSNVEIENRIRKLEFPFIGVTELGSAYFKILAPSYYAGAAIHAGSLVRPDLLAVMQVSQEDRLREEDPGTEQFIAELPIQIIARDSRFEYDLNREEERAIYQTPDMAWGLQVWKRPLTEAEIKVTLAKYREFHHLVDIVVAHLLSQNPFAVLFDCHSYNYQREQRRPWHEDKKPVVNVGTNRVNHSIFAPVIDDLLSRCRQIRLERRPIYTAENEVFRGGYLANRLNTTHHDRLFVPAIEFKKVFMDEWLGSFHEPIFRDLVVQFQAVIRQNTEHSLFKKY